MYKQKILWLSILFLLSQQSGWARCCGRSCPQAINHGQLIQRSNASLLNAQKAAIARTQVIDQYMKLGSQLESKKKWASAEQSFRYVLQVMSLRDGPGSFKSVPVLEHLVTVSKAQNKLDQAIDFQETALRLTKAQTPPNQQAVLDAELRFGDLLLQNKDYHNAELALRDSVVLYNTQASLSQHKRLITYQQYAKVLRQLHKDSDADAIEAEVNANIPQSAAEKLAESK